MTTRQTSVGVFRPGGTRLRRALLAGACLLALIAGVLLARGQGNSYYGYSYPTYSSPIAISSDNRLVWSVNPNDNSVSVIRTDTEALITNIKVGQEPQSIALSPNNEWAYVANAASSNVP